MKGPYFFAKILLFGEYGIINDSMGLSLPFNHFKGSLITSKKRLDLLQLKSHKRVKSFINSLKLINSKVVSFDLDKIRNDIQNQIYFDSNIPQGYGVGSSGALVAAVYDRYAKNKINCLENLTNNKLLKLKLIFSQMESFFHGKSSGLDPLNSYLSLPILIKSSKKIESISIPSQNINGKGAIFLLDSGSAGKTASMVNLFMKNMKTDSFFKMIKDQFILTTNKCVQYFLKSNQKNLFMHLKKLSKLVFINFKPMIPDQFKDIWLKGINNDLYYLKLCGSGGGGYILGFTQNWIKAKNELKEFNLCPIYHF